MRTLSVILGRRRWLPTDAELVLRAQVASGLSIPAFADLHGLQVERLRRWRLRLRGRSAVPVPPAERPSEAISFVPARLRQPDGPEQVRVGPPPPRVPSVLDVSVGGARVHVPRDFDPEHLRRVVAALASPC